MSMSTAPLVEPRPAVWRAYLSLMKPRVISLLLVTALAGVLVASDAVPSMTIVLVTMLGGFLSAGGAHAINCYLDRDIDQLMARTNERAIPSGEVSPERALFFGIVLTVISFLLFALLANLLSAILSLTASLYYVFVYTRWLKRSTPSNIVIGGAAGAFPPVIGWAAARGDLSLLPVWLFVIIFFWTPPHFWALSLLIKREYERARIPMLPIVRGDAETRRQIVWYSFLLVAITILLYPFGMMGLIYLVSAVLLGGVFIYYAIRLRIGESLLEARRLFLYSLSYLALLFVAMVIDRRIPL